MHNGVLEHDLPVAVLEEVVNKFKKIDQVPQGYFYPEIYASENAPKYLTDL